MTVLYQGSPMRAGTWARIFATEAPELAFHLWPDASDPEAIEYLIAWHPPAELLASLCNLKVLFSFGAGVDHIGFSHVPSHVPIVRMVEPGLVSGMIEFVTMAVLALHRNIPDYIAAQHAGVWRPMDSIPATARRVGAMGLGVLGKAVLAALSPFGFSLNGWSRTPKDLAAVNCYSGPAGLGPFLSQTDILICLLPLTAATRGILDSRLFAQLPPGASVINVGRGGHLDDQALLDALDSQHLAGAILDVCEPEPLPQGHPFWGHPQILLTPHIASLTRSETAARAVLENIRRHRQGQPLRDVIDRTNGY